MSESLNLTIQYIIVGVIIIAAAFWILYRLFTFRRKGKVSSCCGCALSDSCQKANLKKTEKCDNIICDNIILETSKEEKQDIPEISK